MILFSIAEFAARRRKRQDEDVAALLPVVKAWLDDIANADKRDDLRDAVADIFAATYIAEGAVRTAHINKFETTLNHILDNTTPDSHPERVATLLAIGAQNAATVEAANDDEEFIVLEWVTMHDNNVRETHQEAEGQQQPPYEKFEVGGEMLRWPGEPVGDPAEWMNCRCTLAPILARDAAVEFGAWKHSTDSSTEPSPDPMAASSGPDPSSTAATASGTSVASAPRQSTGSSGSSTTGNSPRSVSTTPAITGHSQQEPAEVGEPASTGAVSTSTISSPLPPSSRPGTPTFPEARPTSMAGRPTVHRVTSTAPTTSGTGPEATGANSASASPVSVSVLTPSVDRRRRSTPDPGAALDAPVLASTTFGMEHSHQTNGEVMATNDTEVLAAVPWHGVLAPEGKWSGDGRQFAAGSLTNRDLPLPLTWQKASSDGHSGSVTVAKIEHIARVDGEVRGAGHFLSIVEADEVVGMIAEFGKYGVSVDADEAEFELDEETGRMMFSAARIASASIVTIPAFAEAFVALGPSPKGFMDDAKDSEDSEEVDPCDEDSPGYDPEACTEKEMPKEPPFAISEKSWDGSAGRFSPEQWKASCILHVCDGDEKSCHKLPIKEPGGALSRAGVHAAAARFNQVDAPAEAKARAKASLRGAYKQLGEEVPDVIKASEEEVEEFKRGAGWITDPVATKRIHDYWTRPGEEGYVKIGWGKGGDFNRCRVLVGEKIAANSPEDLRFLNQICARWHHDALGIWPGEHKVAGETLPFDAEKTGGPSVALTAGGGWRAPAEFFTDPNLTQPTPLTITDDGKVFGHIAEWTDCHIGYEGVCVAPPHSDTGYAHFLLGELDLSDGSAIPVGVLTYDTGHARAGLRARAAVAHYDDTGTVFGYVTVGEDEHGIWCSGALKPGLTPEQITEVKTAKLSGDWREIGTNLEMVAALAVNTPGYGIVRVAAANGRQVSLVASGVVQPRITTPPPDQFQMEQWAEIVAAAIENRQKRREKMAALAERIGGQ